MALETINAGASAGDGTGDDIRTAFSKANDNFAQLQAAVAAAQAALIALQRSGLLSPDQLIAPGNSVSSAFGARLLKSANLGDVLNTAAARSNLGALGATASALEALVATLPTAVPSGAGHLCLNGDPVNGYFLFITGTG